MKEKIRKTTSWYFAWVIQYWRGLFDFSFKKYFIIQMLPMVYGCLLVALAMGILYFVIEIFITGDVVRGCLYLFVAGPIVFLVAASIIRATIEFYMVIFRIAEDVDELVGIRDTVDKLSGIREAVDQMTNVTKHIPFWSMLGRRKSKSAEEHDDEGNNTAKRNTMPGSKLRNVRDVAADKEEGGH